MFVENPKITRLDAQQRQVHSLLTSINSPTVTLGDNDASPTFGFVCALWSKDKKKLESFIMLYQPKHNISVFYSHEQGAVSEDDYWLIENDALGFTESMGFMMDNLYYAEMSDIQQIETVANFPPFMADRKLYQGVQRGSSGAQQIEKTTVEQVVAAAPPLVELDADAELILDEPLDEPEGAAALVDELSAVVDLSAADAIADLPGNMDLESGMFMRSEEADLLADVQANSVEKTIIGAPAESAIELPQDETAMELASAAEWGADFASAGDERTVFAPAEPDVAATPAPARDLNVLARLLAAF